jgi:hypothetical protein
MSLITLALPNSQNIAEVEFEQLTIRVKSGNEIHQVYHLSGCELGKCCIKDQHSPNHKAKLSDARELNHVLKQFNFTSFVHDRKQVDGSFITKEFKVK